MTAQVVEHRTSEPNSPGSQPTESHVFCLSPSFKKAIKNFYAAQWQVKQGSGILGYSNKRIVKAPSS